nr:fibronectin type III domain-containing protein [Ruminococcus sp.]
DDYIDAKTFTKDTAMDVTVNFEWVDGVEYVQFKPAFANGWAAYQAGGYLTNVNILGTDCTAVTDGAGIGYLTNDGETVGYAMQTSGFFISNDPSCNQVKFTITADGVNKAIENATADDSAFDGLVFQISGVKITSIELSQSGVRLASQHNTPIPDESSVDWSSTDYDDSSHSDIPEWDESDFDNTIGTTIIIKNPVTDAWNNCFPKYDSGYGKKIDDYIDAKTFTKDTPMNVTVNFEWTKYATEQGYIQFRPAFANDWDSIFRYGYMTNVNVIGKNCEYIQDGVGLKTNSGKLIKYAIQSDGFFFSNDPTCNQVRFTITADGVNQMIKNSYYDDGIVLQINGLKVTSIELSQYGVKTASGLSGDLISGNYKYRIINEKAVEIIKYNGSEVNLTIPSIIDGKKVTKIGSNAFENCNRLTSLTIPNSVTNIGEGAFRNCHSLTKIIIPKSVTGIGDYAFYNCDSLLNVTIPDGITEIGNGVFEWCVSLKSVIIPNTVTSIGNSSFAYCNSLTSIKLPNSIKNIDDGAFESCSNLKNITIPIKTEIIGIKVFSGCYNLESVLIPDSVTTIMTNAFASCINLKNVYYTGSKAEWNDIVIASNNDYLKKATVHYNYDPNHKHSYKSTVVKPTYAAQGYTLHKCSTCGASYKDNYKAKLTLGNITKVNFNSSANAVKMSWSKVSGATGYRVYKYNTSTKKWQAVANVKGTSYTFSKLKAGTTYKFTVRAYRTEGGKTYLSPKYSTFTTSTNPATVNFKVTAGSKKATVKWSKVTGATGYKVYYKTSKNGSWKCLKTTNNKTTSYTKTGLTKGKTYYFTVKAYRTVSGKTYNGSYATKSVKVK